MKINWKVVGLVCLILLIVENLFIGWAYYELVKEEEKIYDCYYNICDDYPDAYFENNLCSCYEYDVFGDSVLSKTEYLK